jgi:hypothetical protein
MPPAPATVGGMNDQQVRAVLAVLRASVALGQCHECHKPSRKRYTSVISLILLFKENVAWRQLSATDATGATNQGQEWLEDVPNALFSLSHHSARSEDEIWPGAR